MSYEKNQYSYATPYRKPPSSWNVEPHVLRYWEDELCLNITRNSMGHRIYTDDDLKIFKSIQKSQGKSYLTSKRYQKPDSIFGTSL